jgi:hypothetical protein
MSGSSDKTKHCTFSEAIEWLRGRGEVKADIREDSGWRYRNFLYDGDTVEVDGDCESEIAKTLTALFSASWQLIPKRYTLSSLVPGDTAYATAGDATVRVIVYTDTIEFSRWFAGSNFGWQICNSLSKALMVDPVWSKESPVEE